MKNSMNPAMQKIVNYPEGFTFTIYYSTVPKEKRWPLRRLLGKACKDGWLESIATGLGWPDGFDEEFDVCEEKYVRTGKKE